MKKMYVLSFLVVSIAESITPPLIYSRTSVLTPSVIHVASQSRDVYVLDQDSQNKSNCNDACIAAWTPVLLDGYIHVYKPITGVIGNFTRTDGKGAQMTLGGLPLYWCNNIEVDFDCHGASNAGKVGWLVSPAGIKISNRAFTGPAAPRNYSEFKDNTANDLEMYTKATAFANFTEYLVDGGGGLPLYAWAGDTQNKSSNCLGSCASILNPFYSWGVVQKDGLISYAKNDNSIFANKVNNVLPAMVGRVNSSDDKSQASYNGWPLYTCNNTYSMMPSCQAVNISGAFGYMVSPAGQFIKTPLPVFPTTGENPTGSTSSAMNSPVCHFGIVTLLLLLIFSF